MRPIVTGDTLTRRSQIGCLLLTVPSLDGVMGNLPVVGRERTTIPLSETEILIVNQCWTCTVWGITLLSLVLPEGRLGSPVDSYVILKNYMKSCKTVLVDDSKLVYYRAFFLLLYNIHVLLLVWRSTGKLTYYLVFFYQTSFFCPVEFNRTVEPYSEIYHVNI